MKMKKILASMAAMAVAATMAISASADYEVPAENIKLGTAAGDVAYLIGDAAKEENGPFNDKAADLAKCVAIEFTLELDEAEAADCIAKDAGNGTWVGGGIGLNSTSNGWKQLGEWSPQDGTKEITLEKVSDGVYKGTIKKEDGSALFTDAEEYAQVWVQDWSTKKSKLKSVTLVGVDAPKAEEEKPADKPADDGNADTGVTAGLAFAGLALAGAAIVATKKK